MKPLEPITLKIFFGENRALYKVCLKSNVTERMARELAKLASNTSRDLTFLPDVQCKFQLDSINTSDLTASYVSVCSSDAL
jgi:hypothetical protein